MIKLNIDTYGDGNGRTADERAELLACVERMNTVVTLRSPRGVTVRVPLSHVAIRRAAGYVTVEEN